MANRYSRENAVDTLKRLGKLWQRKGLDFNTQIERFRDEKGRPLSNEDSEILKEGYDSVDYTSDDSNYDMTDDNDI